MCSFDQFVFSEKNQFIVPSWHFSDHELLLKQNKTMYETLLLKTLTRRRNESQDNNRKQTIHQQTTEAHLNTQEKEEEEAISKLLRQRQLKQTMHNTTTKQCTIIDNRTNMPAYNAKPNYQNQHTTYNVVMNKSRCWFNSTPLVIFSIFLISIISISDWQTVHALQTNARFGSSKYYDNNRSHSCSSHN